MRLGEGDFDELGVVTLDALGENSAGDFAPWSSSSLTTSTASFEGPSEGGGVVERILDVDVGAAIEQELYDFDMAAIAGEEKRRGSVGRFRVDAGAFIEQL